MEIISWIYPSKQYPCIITYDKDYNHYITEICDCCYNIINRRVLSTIEECIIEANIFYSTYDMKNIRDKYDLKPYEIHFSNGVKLRNYYNKKYAARVYFTNLEKDVEELDYDTTLNIVQQINDLLSQLK